tara:strand:+ start:182 stop:1006 length:825 start_codon:yes stop_codon:yes gene_type:complete
MEKNIIFDFGCNEGQNFDYFLEKADYVIGVEANPYLIKDLLEKFSKPINEGRLFIENKALLNTEKNIDFFVSKKSTVLSQVSLPKKIDDWEKINIISQTPSNLIKKYLKKLNITKVFYIKIDVECSDYIVLKDIIDNSVISQYLSIEMQDPNIINLLLQTPYRSIKFMDGIDIGRIVKKITLIDKKGKNKEIVFKRHSSGPFGDDIPSEWYSMESLIPYFLNNGCGWKDIHCCIEDKKYGKTIVYKKKIHAQGFGYHCKRIIPSFIKMLNNKFR